MNNNDLKRDLLTPPRGELSDRQFSARVCRGASLNLAPDSITALAPVLVKADAVGPGWLH